MPDDAETDAGDADDAAAKKAGKAMCLAKKRKILPMTRLSLLELQRRPTTMFPARWTGNVSMN